MFGLSPMEIGIIVLLALLIFGHRLPGLARSLGKSILNFKRGLREGDRTKELDEAVVTELPAPESRSAPTKEKQQPVLSKKENRVTKHASI